MRHNSLLILTFLSAVSLFAQSANRISGKVLDLKDKTPLIAVTILVEELKTGTYSDENGHFTLANIPNGKYTLRFSLVGHKTKRITLTVPSNEAGSLIAELEDGSVDMHEIVVTGNPFASLKSEISQSSLTLSARDLEIKRGVNIGETLNFQPGVSVRSNGTATSRPIIRGFSNNRILILENGLRMGDLSNTSDDHSVSSDGGSTEKIELVRGPASLLYGSNAIGGVVNVITQSIPTQVPDAIHGEITLEGNTGSNQLAQSADIHAGSGRFAFHTSLLSRKADEYRDGAGNKVANSDFKNSGIQGGFSYIPYKETYGISFNTFSSEYGIPFNNSEAADGVLIKLKKSEIRGLIENQQAGSFISAYSLKAGYQNYEHEEMSKTSGVTGTTFGIKTFSADLSLIHAPITEGSKGIAGLWLLAQSYTVTGEEAFTPNADYFSAAGFLFEQFRVNPFTLEAGARLELNNIKFPSSQISGKEFPSGDKSLSAVSFSVGAIYNINESAAIFTNMATAFRAPTIEELSSYAIHDATGSFDIGSRDLVKENNTGFDLGLRVTRPNHSVELSAYYNDLTDYIYKASAGYFYNSSNGEFTSNSAGAFPVYKYLQGDARIYGFEAKAEYELNTGFTTIVIFDYTRGKLANGENLPQMPPLRFSLEERYATDNFWTGFNLKLANGQNLTAPLETYTAGYALLDLYAGIRIISGGFIQSINLKVENALSQQYRDHLSAIKDFALMPGRNIRLNYKILF